MICLRWPSLKLIRLRVRQLRFSIMRHIWPCNLEGHALTVNLNYVIVKDAFVSTVHSLVDSINVSSHPVLTQGGGEAQT